MTTLAEVRRANRNERYIALIEARGGEIEITGQYRAEHISVTDEAHGLVLFHAAGWRQYSRSYGARRAVLSYLCGRDDNGIWAVRVPGTITTVKTALDHVTPAPVRKAILARKPWLRQGDVYVVKARRDDFSALRGTRHAWDGVTRTINHLDAQNPHSALLVPFKAKAIMQRVLRMGRLGNRRTRYGD